VSFCRSHALPLQARRSFRSYIHGEVVARMAVCHLRQPAEVRRPPTRKEEAELLWEANGAVLGLGAAL
jgi:hypothetical protein